MTKETIKNVTKMAIQTAAYIGSGAIAGAYIATAPFLKVPGRLMKACIWVGGGFLQDFVAATVAKNAELNVDAFFNTIDTVINKEAKSDGTEDN